MAKFLGVDLPRVLARSLGKLVAPVVLKKVVQTTPAAGHLTGGLQPTTTSYRCRGFIDGWPGSFPSNMARRQGQTSAASPTTARKDFMVTILGGTLRAGIEPAVGDKVTVKNVTYDVVAVGVDPAYSVGPSASYKLTVRGG